jgi:hypothetical protein
LTYVINDIKITKMDNTGTFDYPFTPTSWIPAADRDQTYVAGLPEAGVSLEAIGTSAAAQKLLSANDLMMVLPQTVTAGTLDPVTGAIVTDETFVEVTYSLKDGAGVPIFTDEVRKLTLTNGFKFEAGKRYNFEFEFGGTSGAGVDAISFTVTLNPWTDVVPNTELPQ